jgi:methionyl-tRNA synthetase
MEVRATRMCLFAVSASVSIARRLADYCEARAKETINADLADNIGNLLSRSTSLVRDSACCVHRSPLCP